MNNGVLQEGQFFRDRVGRAEEYARRHKNGHAESDDEEPETREVEAHKNVFGR